MSLCALMISYSLAFCVTVFGAISSAAEGAEMGTEAVDESILQKEYNLAGERSAEPRYYHMETKVIQFEEDGTRTHSYTLRLYLMCVPAGQSPQDGRQYTCVKYTFLKGNGPMAFLFLCLFVNLWLKKGIKRKFISENYLSSKNLLHSQRLRFFAPFGRSE